jgi:hypothetical protein
MFRFVASMLALLFSVPALLAEPADEGLKKEYHAFAKLFSMRSGQLREAQQHDRDGKKRATDALSLNLSNPVLKQAAAEFKLIGSGCTAARACWDFKPDELKKKEVQLMMKTLVAEIKEDDKARAEIIGQALTGALKKEAAERAGNLLYLKVRARHGDCWKKILPLAKQCAGSADLKGAVGFDLYIHPQIMYRELFFENSSKKTLTNITLALETNASASLDDKSKRYFLFIEELKPGNTVMLDTVLADKFAFRQRPKAMRNCLTYSIWCDQGNEEDIVLQMTGRNGRSPAVAMGTIFFPFTRQR